MPKDAIQEDVSNEDNPKPTPYLNPRNAHMDEIMQRSREEREEQMRYVGQEPPVDEPESNPSPDSDPEPGKKEEIPATKDDDGNDEELVKLKVDGKDVEVPRSKVMEMGQRAMQKELAADQNLAEAKRLKSEAQALLDRAKEEQQHSTDADQNEQLSSIADRLQFGDKEEGTAAIKELANLMNVNTEKMDMDALSTQIVQQVEERQEWQNASAYVEENYSDVMSDPTMKQLFGIKENELRDAGDKRPYKELYTAIAEDLRSWKNDLGPTKPADTLEDRRAKKQTSSAPPGGHSAPANKSSQPEPPKTAREVIAEMRKNRGQT